MIPKSGDRVENAVIDRKTSSLTAATYPGFQNSLRLALNHGNWIGDSVFQSRLLSLASDGGRATFQWVDLSGALRFGSRLSLTRAEGYHRSGKFSATGAAPLVSDTWKGGMGNWSIASGVTSKPTIEGHFKTDQWAITLDKNLFYRARCGGGNPSSDLIGAGLECLAA